jgi:hypothetical protein
MKTMKECENLTNVKLLAEISNRNTLLKTMKNPARAEQLKGELEHLWNLMRKNGYK